MCLQFKQLEDYEEAVRLREDILRKCQTLAKHGKQLKAVNAKLGDKTKDAYRWVIRFA